MELRSGLGKIEQKRNVSVDSNIDIGNVLSPASVAMSPDSDSMTMNNHLGQPLATCSLEGQNINIDQHGYTESLISDDSEQLCDSEYDGMMGDTHSDCATDYEDTLLGVSGLSLCEYGPSVDEEGVEEPIYVYECTRTDCMWVVCIECHQKGGHKRHR